jgi:hypothetical protein
LWGSTPPQKPATNMMRKLSSQRQAITRLRQKLNPELAREPSDSSQSGVLALVASRNTFSCPWGCIIQAPVSDWMEWQASYVCGAILMPLSVVRSLIQKSESAWNKHNPIPADSILASELTARVAGVFDVSADAAQVRLHKLGIIK